MIEQVPILIPEGFIADLSPGIVFLLAPIFKWVNKASILVAVSPVFLMFQTTIWFSVPPVTTSNPLSYKLCANYFAFLITY